MNGKRARNLRSAAKSIVEYQIGQHKQVVTEQVKEKYTKAIYKELKRRLKDDLSKTR